MVVRPVSLQREGFTIHKGIKVGDLTLVCPGNLVFAGKEDRQELERDLKKFLDMLEKHGIVVERGEQ